LPRLVIGLGKDIERPRNIQQLDPGQGQQADYARCDHALAAMSACIRFCPYST
jgi:hypothetical protein